MGDGELYRVRHGGLKDEELVTGETPQMAAARFIQARGNGTGFICVKEPGGREHRFFVRKKVTKK